MGQLMKTSKMIWMIFSKTFKAIMIQFQKEVLEEETTLLQFRKLKRLGCELVADDMKILEILIHEGEEAYDAEYFAVEEHRKKLDVTQ
jgi:hypothetical protein